MCVCIILNYIIIDIKVNIQVSGSSSVQAVISSFVQLHISLTPSFLTISTQIGILRFVFNFFQKKI